MCGLGTKLCVTIPYPAGSMDLTLQPVPIPSDLYRTKLIPSPYDGVPIMRTTGDDSCTLWPGGQHEG